MHNRQRKTMLMNKLATIMVTKQGRRDKTTIFIFVFDGIVCVLYFFLLELLRRDNAHPYSIQTFKKSIGFKWKKKTLNVFNLFFHLSLLLLSVCPFICLYFIWRFFLFSVCPLALGFYSIPTFPFDCSILFICN